MGVNWYHSESCAWNHHNKLRDKSAKRLMAAEKKRKREITKANAAEKRAFYDKDRPHQLKVTEKICNKYIRIRDKGLPCISCGKNMVNGSWVGGASIHAGHYKSVKAFPELRYNEFNINSQCSGCNKEGSGNAIGYRLGLIAKIGEDKVVMIESYVPLKNYTIPNLKTIQRWFKRKTKRLEQC